MATSTGLVAPILALDGLPSAMAPPTPVPWDDLAHGSVAMVSEVVEPLAQLAPGLFAPPAERTGLLRAATPWVRAAGVTGTGVASESEVLEAAELLGIEPAPEVDRAAVQAVRNGVLQEAQPAAAALGLVSEDATVTATDIRAAADALDVPAPDGVTPAVVETVAERGQEIVDDRLAEVVTPYAEALGLDIGAPDPGDQVDPGDVVALAEALGADVGADPGPAEVSDLLAELDDASFTPPVVGHVGAADLHLPSRDVLLAGWHEPTGPSALPMEPADIGLAVDLPTRSRPFDPHAALDVAVTPGTQAVAPVEGTVVEVTPYMLYGEHPDTRIVIQPDDAPGVGVAVLHVTGPLVEVGDHLSPLLLAQRSMPTS